MIIWHYKIIIQKGGIIIEKKKELRKFSKKSEFSNSKGTIRFDESTKLYNKNKLKPIIKDTFIKVSVFLFSFCISLFTLLKNVYAVDKIEGGDVTIESLGTIVKSLATKIQVFGIVLAFISLIVFVIQFIIGDDETKQRKKKTILYTLGGVVLLILVPSLINFIIDTIG